MARSSFPSWQVKGRSSSKGHTRRFEFDEGDSLLTDNTTRTARAQPSLAYDLGKASMVAPLLC